MKIYNGLTTEVETRQEKLKLAFASHKCIRISPSFALKDIEIDRKDIEWLFVTKV